MAAVQGILVSYIGKIRNNTTKWTDERVRLAGEAVAGCLAVKMLGCSETPSVMRSEIPSAMHEEFGQLHSKHTCLSL